MAQSFGRFWLQEKVGHGGMAEVFRATIGPDPDTYAFDFALKRMHENLKGDTRQVDMFMTEADIAKFLQHPNLIQVYDSGLVDSVAYIAMEFISGLDLARLQAMLRRKRIRFPADLAVHVIMSVLRGLDYVHRARAPGGAPMDLVHRDITPENIYLTFNGEVKFGDFGVARVSFLEGPEEREIVVGKLRYVPPEVLAGQRVSCRDDLWSLSVTFYEMVTGKPLFADLDEDELRAGRFARRVEPVERINPDIGPALAKIFARALHPNPKKRFQTAADLYKELKAYLRDEGIHVTPEALGNFVQAATGSGQASLSPPPPQTKEREGAFGKKGYRSPMGPSLTQRFEATRRRRLKVWPLAVGGLLLFGGAIVWFIVQ